MDIDFLDCLARRESTEQVLEWVDRETLEPSGLSRSDIESLRSVWRKLFTRRLRRKRA